MTKLIRPDWPAPGNVRAFSTTRVHGYSKGPWSGLNLGKHCGDDSNHVDNNRRDLQALLPSAPVWLRQVHGNNVIEWQESIEPGTEADAIFSHRHNQVCAVLTADCLPVLFCDTAGTRVAAAHAGWRGLAAGILEATVAALGCGPSQLMAWLGPAIGPQAFEVGAEVYEIFVKINSENALAFSPYHDKYIANLYELARLALNKVGVRQVSGGDYCTYSEPDRFFSYRRDGVTGRMASVIWLES